MVAKVDDSGARSDKLMVWGAVLLAAAALVGFYLTSEVALLYRVLGLLVGLGLALFVFSRTTQGRMALGYIEDSRTEMREALRAGSSDANVEITSTATNQKATAAHENAKSSSVSSRMRPSANASGRLAMYATGTAIAQLRMVCLE